jgi:hypothetical protein
LASFASRKTFTSPYADQSYTFVLSGLPNAVSMVAYAIVLKKNSRGVVTSSKVAWGDGCSGKQITCVTSKGNDDNKKDDKEDKDKNKKEGNDDNGNNGNNDNGDDEGNHDSGCSSSCDNEELVGGSYFTYSSTACVIPPLPVPLPVPVQIVLVEPDICSNEMANFFGIHPAYGCEIAWDQPTVTVAGYTYTEAEARAIGNAPNGFLGLTQDSKYAFQRAATLVLSNTDYTASPTVGPAMKTILDWLSTKGKLSPSNLPTGNVLVKTQAVFLDTWITAHICTGRR